MHIEQGMELSQVPEEQASAEPRLVLNHEIHQALMEAGMIAQVVEIQTPRLSFYEAREIHSIRTHRRSR